MAALKPNNRHASQFEQLARRFRPALMAFFLRRLGNFAEAEDMTQEVFTRLAATDPSRTDSTEAYIFQMAANLLRDRCRREKVRFDFRAEAMADERGGVDMLDPPRFAAGRQSLDVLVAALQELPEMVRTIFVLYRLEHVDRCDIAHAFNVSQNVVDLYLTRAMAYLTRRVKIVE